MMQYRFKANKIAKLLGSKTTEVNINSEEKNKRKNVPNTNFQLNIKKDRRQEKKAESSRIN
jgi:hypothetical protein